MLSWQFKLLEIYFRLQHTLSSKAGKVDVSKERAEVESLASMFKMPKGTKAVTELADGVRAEWVIPPVVSTGRVILYLHGGSYVAGSINSHRSLAGNIAVASKARVLIIDYRLAPEHPHPAALEDASTVYRWLISNHADPAHLAVAGDSAGGGLAMALLVALRDKAIPLPAACVCLSPLTDMTFSSESWKSNIGNDLMIHFHKEREFSRMYMGKSRPQDPLVSPIFADLKGLPPILIQVGTCEVLLSDARGLVERARQAGVNAVLEEWEKMQHEWQFTAGFIPEGRRAITSIGEFINRWA
jgi:epsilon-lactone hydrolase